MIGKCIAFGGTADVHEMLDDHTKIIKLSKVGAPVDCFDWEMTRTKEAGAAGAMVPIMYETAKIDDRIGLIMERIDGLTISQTIQQMCARWIDRGIFDEESKKMALSIALMSASITAQVLARLHTVKIKSPAAYTAHDQLLYCTNSNSYLSESEKSVVRLIIEKLPYGDSLCHGDPNPNNIIGKQQDWRLIDWSGWVKADVSYDLAEVVIMYRYNPIRHPAQNEADEFYHSLNQPALDCFLYEYNRLTGTVINEELLDKWVCPKLVMQLTGSNSHEYKLQIANELRGYLSKGEK